MTRREQWGPALGTKYKYFEKIDDKLPLRLVWEAWGVIPKLMVKVESSICLQKTVQELGLNTTESQPKL